MPQLPPCNFATDYNKDQFQLPSSTPFKPIANKPETIRVLLVQKEFYIMEAVISPDTLNKIIAPIA